MDVLGVEGGEEDFQIFPKSKCILLQVAKQYRKTSQTPVARIT